MHQRRAVGNRYTILGKLGEGGMGGVFLASDRLLSPDHSATVALKFLPRTRDQQKIEFFKQEFRLLSRLHHPCLARVFDFGFDPKEDRLFFTQEYCPGHLFDAKALNFSDFEAKCFLVFQLLHTLQYIHDQGVTHNDLKPSNIMVHEKKLKLLDFGIGWEKKTETSFVVAGTPGFIAPEVLQGGPPSVQSDLFAIGMLLNRLCQVSSIARNQKKIVSSLLRYSERLVEDDPQKRPISASQVAVFLGKMFNGFYDANRKVYSKSFATQSWADESTHSPAVLSVLKSVIEFFLKSPQKNNIFPLSLLIPNQDLQQATINALKSKLQPEQYTVLTFSTGNQKQASFLFELARFFFDSGAEGASLNFLKANRNQSRSMDDPTADFLYDEKILFFHHLTSVLNDVLKKLKLVLVVNESSQISSLEIDFFKYLTVHLHTPLAVIFITEAIDETHSVLSLWPGEVVTHRVVEKSVERKKIKAPHFNPETQQVLGACAAFEDEISVSLLANILRPLASLRLRMALLRIESRGDIRKIDSGHYQWASENSKIQVRKALSENPKTRRILFHFYYKLIALTLENNQESGQSLEGLHRLYGLYCATNQPAKAAEIFFETVDFYISRWALDRAEAHLLIIVNQLNTLSVLHQTRFHFLHCEILYLRGFFEKSLKALAPVFPLQTSPSADLAKWYLRKGFILRNLKNFDKSQRALEKGLEILSQVDDPVLKARILAQRAIGHWQNNESKNAFAVIEEALNLLGNDHNHPSRYAYLLNIKAGFLFANPTNDEESFSIYKKTLSLFENCNDQRGVALSLHNLGLIHARQNQYLKATEHFEKSLHAARSIGDLRRTIQGYDALARVYESQNDLDRAEGCFAEALNLCGFLNDRNTIVVLQMYRSRIFSKRGLYQAAHSILEDMLGSSDVGPHLATCLQQQIDFCLTAGNKAGAKKKIDQLKMVVSNTTENFSRTLNLIEAEYEFICGHSEKAWALASIYLRTANDGGSVGDFQGLNLVHLKIISHLRGIGLCSESDYAEIRVGVEKLVQEERKKKSFLGLQGLIELARDRVSQKDKNVARAYIDQIKDAYGLSCKQFTDLWAILNHLEFESAPNTLSRNEQVNLTFNAIESVQKICESLSGEWRVGFQTRPDVIAILNYQKQSVTQSAMLMDSVGRLGRSSHALHLLFTLAAAPRHENKKALDTVFLSTVSHFLGADEVYWAERRNEQWLITEQMFCEGRLLKKNEKEMTTVLFENQDSILFSSTPIELVTGEILIPIFIDELFQGDSLHLFSGVLYVSGAKTNVDRLKELQILLTCRIQTFRRKEALSEKFERTAEALRSTQFTQSHIAPSERKSLFLPAEIQNQVRLASRNRLPVVICGESGTGKEVVAKLVHEAGSDYSKPFIVFHAGSGPDHLMDSLLFGHRQGAFTDALMDHVGYFQLAHGGTLVIDGVDELKPDMQVKLLRTLQMQEVLPLGETKPIPIQVRVIALTRSNLSQLVRSGQFREDLFYRLNVLNLELMPLRQRRQEIPKIVEALLVAISMQQKNRPAKVSARAMQTILHDSWPGNIRQLRNALEVALSVGNGRLIRDEDLPKSMTKIGKPLEKNWSFSKASAVFEKAYLGNLFQMVEDDLKKAASVAKITPRTLYNLRKRYRFN